MADSVTVEAAGKVCKTRQPRPKIGIPEAFESLEKGAVCGFIAEWGNGTGKKKAVFLSVDGENKALMPANTGDKLSYQDYVSAKNTMSIIASAVKTKIKTF